MSIGFGFLIAWFLYNATLKRGVYANDIAAESTSTVFTLAGPISGLRRIYNGSTVSQFLGIPFAEPPIGGLRFKQPVPRTTWNTTFIATRFQASCMQHFFVNDEWLMPNLNMSEDCLHLNVFVPGTISSDSNSNRAVMIWIHGGGFTAGQASIFDGSYLALTGDVIVVTINYRLGLFGFLSTEDESARGNYGIWDQVLAIKWVHDNIKYFGGDPSNVCIFGESAGAYSVGIHTVLPINRGRIKRAISESGNVFSPRVLATDVLLVARRAAEHLNCSIDRGTDKMVECLRLKPAKHLLNVQNDAYSGFDEPLNFVNRLGPVVDGVLIPDTPVKLLQNNTSEAFTFFKSLDVMVGTNNAEGGLMYWTMMNYQHQYHFNITDGIPREVLCDIVAKAAARSYYKGSEVVSELVCRQYDISNGSLPETGRSTFNIYGDLLFTIPTVRTLDTHSSTEKGGNSFQYIFTHQPRFSWIQDRPPWLEGANHAGELPFVFGLYAMYPKERKKLTDEQTLSKQVMTYWSNFAKTGYSGMLLDTLLDPNGHSGKHLPHWPAYDTLDRAYLNLTVMPKAEYYLYKDRVNFWTKTVPNVIDNNYNTHVVNTKLGPISGISKKYGSKWVDQFLGVPYAEPPVGLLRFEKPVEKQPWTNTLMATRYPSPCTQPNNPKASEDCLYLNVYVPENTTVWDKKVVMVWIHGGAYITGTSSDKDGSYLALHGNVILVTINYRLGLFGFLSTEDENSPGNYGLWDQVLAIKWVHENIEAFGGDSKRICIFGESAGGYSVGLQIILPINKGRFNCAICESGTVTSPRAVAVDAGRVARRAGKLVDCPTENGTKELVICLKSVQANDLLNIQYKAYQEINRHTDFLNRLGPVVDGELLTDTPLNLLKKTNSTSYKMFNDLNLIVGSNSMEGSLIYELILDLQEKYQFNISEGIPKRVLCGEVAKIAVLSYFSDNASIAEDICAKYSSESGNGNFPITDMDEMGRQALDIYGDINFMIPTIQTLDSHSAREFGGSSYQYFFIHKPSYSYVKGRPEWLSGATHAQELPFVFGLDAVYPVTQPKPSDERVLSRNIMSYWTNFAKTGNPNSGSEKNLPIWPAYEINRRAYMEMSISPTPKEHLYEDRVEFWSEYIPFLDMIINTKHNDLVNESVTVKYSTLSFAVALVLIITNFV